MKQTGVADLNVFVKMKHTEKKMKPIDVWSPDIGIGMFDTGVADLNARVKMKDAE